MSARRIWPKILILLATLLAVAASTGAALWISYIRSPQYSIAMLAHAVVTKDWPGVQRYVDVKSVTDAAVEEELARGLGDAQGPLEQLVRRGAESAKPSLTRAATDALHEAVVQGNDWGAPAATKLASIMAVSSYADVEVDVDTAKVVVTPPASVGPIRFRMARVDDHWRIVQVEDIVDLVAGLTRVTGVGSSGRSHPLFDLNRLSTADIVDALRELGVPITDAANLSAETDPDGKLGEPGQYLQKAIWSETGTGPLDPSKPAGAVEVYASADEAARHARPSTPKAISYQIGNVVVVVDGALTPQRAAAYAEVFKRVE